VRGIDIYQSADRRVALLPLSELDMPIPLPDKFMDRRDFVATLTAILAGMSMTACSTGPVITTSSKAKRRSVIDTGFYATLEHLYQVDPGARKIVGSARGILIFPTVIPSGSSIRALYGEGVLRVADAMFEYCSMQSPALAIPSGVPADEISFIFLFMAQDALANFQAANNWVIQQDTPITMLSKGKRLRANEAASTPIIVFALGPQGLISYPSLRGMTISSLDLIE
jgi:lipid-binding SYLF domain-containing protein